MSVLEAVMRQKELEQQKMQFQTAQTMSLIDSFVKQAQQRRAEEITLAGAGLKRTPEGFVRDDSLKSPIDKFIELGNVAKASDAIYKAGGGSVNIGGLESGGIPAGGAIGGMNTASPTGGYVAKTLDRFGRPKEYELVDEEAKNKSKDMVLSSAQDTLNTISEIEKGSEHFGATGDLWTLNPWDYERKNWVANVDKLKGKLVLDLMTNMKSASKTGATGFGQLSEKELEVLQNSATALKRGLSKEDASKYLTEIKTKAQKVLGVEPENSFEVPAWLPKAIDPKNLPQLMESVRKRKPNATDEEILAFLKKEYFKV
jgi:hypothetical protein